MSVNNAIPGGDGKDRFVDPSPPTNTKNTSIGGAGHSVSIGGVSSPHAKSIGATFKNFLGSIKNLIPARQISTIPLPLRNKLQNELAHPTMLANTIKLTYVEFPDRTTDRQLKENVHDIQFSWSDNVPQFEKNGMVVIRYFNTNTGKVENELLEIHVKNPLSLREVTEQVYKTIQEKHTENCQAITTELASKKQALENDLGMKIVTDPKDPLFSDPEALKKGVLLLNNDGTLELFRGNVKNQKIKFNDDEAEGKRTPCNVLTTSIDAIKNSIKELVDNQNIRLFENFDKKPVNSAFKNQQITFNISADRGRNQLQDAIRGNTANQSNIFITPDLNSSTNIATEPQFRILYAAGGKIYEETVPIAPPNTLIQKLKEINERKSTGNQRISEIVAEAQKTCGDTVKIIHNQSTNSIEIQYQDYVDLKNFKNLITLKPDEMNPEEFKQILEAHITEAKGVANERKAMLLVIRGNPTIILGRAADSNQQLLNKLKPAHTAAIASNEQRDIVRIIVRDDNAKEKYQIIEVKVNSQLTVEEMKTELTNEITKAKALPEKKKIELEERKTQAEETRNEVAEDDEFKVNFDNNSIRVTPSSDYTSFTVEIKDPYSEGGVWKKTTKGIETGIGMGDGQLLDLVGEAQDRLKIIEAVKDTSQKIIQTSKNAFGAELFPISEQKLTADMLINQGVAVGIRVSKDNSVLHIFGLDPSSPTGISEVTLNLLDYSSEDAIKLAKVHLQDMASRKELAQNGELTRAAKQIVTPVGTAVGTIEGVRLDELQTMWASINFTNTKNPFYVNPNSIDDGGRPIERSVAKHGLDTFVNKLINRPINRDTHADGIPENAAARKKFYDALECKTKEIILRMRELRDSDPAQFTHCLCELAAAGGHCGSRYLNTIDYLHRLTSGKLDQGAAGVQAEIHVAIDDFKIGVVDRWVGTFEANEPTHIRNYAFKRLQKEGIAITGQELLTEKDHYETIGVIPIAARAKSRDPNSYYDDDRSLVRQIYELATLRPIAINHIKNELLPQLNAGQMVDVVQSKLLAQANTDDTFRDQLTGEMFEVLKKQGKAGAEYLEQLKQIEDEYIQANEKFIKAEKEYNAKLPEDRNEAHLPLRPNYTQHQQNIRAVQQKALQAANWYSPVAKVDGKITHHFSHEAVVELMKDMKMLTKK